MLSGELGEWLDFSAFSRVIKTLCKLILERFPEGTNGDCFLRTSSVVKYRQNLPKWDSHRK